MIEFNCKRCGNNHKLVTLLELPKPKIISEITSGKNDSTLNIISKSLFLIDKKHVLVQCELSINIIEFEDSLDYLIWVKIPAESLRNKLAKTKNTNIISLDGKPVGQIPFYKHCKNIKVWVNIDINKNEMPVINKIEGNSELKQDFERGISLEKLENILTEIYHAS